MFGSNESERQRVAVTLTLHSGDLLSLHVPGSGGMYEPAGRDALALAHDIADGLVTREAALRDYGRAPGLDDAA